MAIALNVGGIHFKTKKLLIAHVRELISNYPLGAMVSQIDQTFLQSLFIFHPDAERKLQGGIFQIEVRLDDYGNKYFYILRNNGDGEEISWTKCVNNARPE